MIQYLHIVICLLLAAPAQKDSIGLPLDRNSTLIERQVSGDLSEKYSGPEFRYELDRGESVNLLSRFVHWFLNTLGDIFGVDISPTAVLVFEYVIYVLMGALALYLVIRMFINERFSSLFTQKARSIVDLELSQHHIETLDLDTLVEEALKERNYRLAVRYRFLKILKLLSQRELIDWHYEKTNMDYLEEISHGPLQGEFKKASYLFENIWYGQQPIDEMEYREVDHSFDSLNKSIP